jgi:hypothetical protein
MKRLYETPSFLALNSWGDDAMKSAIKNFRTSIEKAKSGITDIQAEKDDQIDDIIKVNDITSANDELANNGSFSVASISDVLDTIAAVLAGPYTINYTNESVTYNYNYIDAIYTETSETTRTDISIKLNVSAVFDNPIADLKTKFFKFTWKAASEWRDGEDSWYEYVGNGEGNYSYNYETGEYWYNPAGDGSYVIKYNYDPISFTDANGTVLTDAEMDTLKFPYFPDYTFGGLFPDMTRQGWIDLIDDLSGPDESSGKRRAGKQLGFSLGSGLK